MKNKLFIAIIPCVLFCLLLTDIPTVSAQVINSESFDGAIFPPSGWVVTGGTNSRWVRRINGTNPTCSPHSGLAMARFTVVMGGPTGGQELIATPVIDYSGANGSIPTFSLWVYRDGTSTAGDSLTILVNTSNSLVGAVRIGAVARSRFFILPVNELSDGWYNYSFNVPSSFTSSSNYILLNGTSKNGANIFIDDLQWDEFPVACSGIVSAGSVIANDTLFCNGTGNTNLSLSGTGLTVGGLSFQWQTSPDGLDPWTDFGNSSSSINTGIINSTSFFRCMVSCSGGGVDTSSITEVMVLQAPIAGFNYSWNDLTYNFIDTSTGTITTWLWDFGDGNFDSSQNSLHTYAANGNYTITLTVSDGFCSTTSTQTITVVSISEFGDSNNIGLIIYPNPIANNAIIEFISRESIVRLSLVNTMGQVISSFELKPVEMNKFKSEIDLSKVPAGIYMLKSSDTKFNISTRIIKQ